MEAMDQTIVSDLDERARAFQQRFLRVSTGGLGSATFIAFVATLIVAPEPIALSTLGCAAVAGISAFVLTFTARSLRLPAAIFLFGASLSAGAGFAGGVAPGLELGAVQALLVCVMLAPFLLGRAGTASLFALDVVLIVIAHARMAIVDGTPTSQILASAFGTPAVLAVIAFSVTLFVERAQQNQAALRQRLLDIDVVVERAKRIATGDLSGAVVPNSEVSNVIASMLAGLRSLVEQIQTNAGRLASATSEIAAMAQQQEKSAMEQGSAIEETRRTVGSLLDASRQIAVSARGVTDDAEATLRNAELITERIHTLSEHAQRITDVLELIRDVANKSELLALNAALEGAKAGEAGRGFSLVASQMQRLAESVMSSVKVVKDLTADIRRATNATALATEDATKLAGSTTDAARRIGVITQQQETSTEEVTRAMDEIADATHQSAAGTNQTLQAVRELSQIADQLNRYAAQFQL